MSLSKVISLRLASVSCRHVCLTSCAMSCSPSVDSTTEICTPIDKEVNSNDTSVDSSSSSSPEPRRMHLSAFQFYKDLTTSTDPLPRTISQGKEKEHPLPTFVTAFIDQLQREHLATLCTSIQSFFPASTDTKYTERCEMMSNNMINLDDANEVHDRYDEFEGAINRNDCLFSDKIADLNASMKKDQLRNIILSKLNFMPVEDRIKFFWTHVVSMDTPKKAKKMAKKKTKVTTTEETNETTSAEGNATNESANIRKDAGAHFNNILVKMKILKPGMKIDGTYAPHEEGKFLSEYLSDWTPERDSLLLHAAELVQDEITANLGHNPSESDFLKARRTYLSRTTAKFIEDLKSVQDVSWKHGESREALISNRLRYLKMKRIVKK